MKTPRLTPIALILMGLIAPIIITWGYGVGADIPPDQADIDSKFIIIQNNVIAFDDDIKIKLYSWNNTEMDYTIMVDHEIIFNGTFLNYKSIDYRIKKNLVREFKIFINGSLVYHKNNLIIYRRNSYTIGDDNGGSNRVFEFSWNDIKNARLSVWGAIITAFFISLYPAYKDSKKIRKTRGARKWP